MFLIYLKLVNYIENRILQSLATCSKMISVNERKINHIIQTRGIKLLLSKLISIFPHFQPYVNMLHTLSNFFSSLSTVTSPLPPTFPPPDFPLPPHHQFAVPYHPTFFFLISSFQSVPPTLHLPIPLPFHAFSVCPSSSLLFPLPSLLLPFCIESHDQNKISCRY